MCLPLLNPALRQPNSTSYLGWVLSKRESTSSVADLGFVLVRDGSPRCFPAHPQGLVAFASFLLPVLWAGRRVICPSLEADGLCFYSLPIVPGSEGMYFLSPSSWRLALHLGEGFRDLYRVACLSALSSQVLTMCLSHYGGLCLICPPLSPKPVIETWGEALTGECNSACTGDLQLFYTDALAHIGL